MWKVYILFSRNFRRTYVGYSSNVEERLKTHNRGSVKSTKRYRPWELVYEEDFEKESIARRREKYYKSSVGRRKIRYIFDVLGLNF